MRIRHAKLATALLTTTAIGVGVVEIQANLAARSELHRLLDHNRDLKVGSIFAEPLTGRLTLHGLTAGTGATRIAIGTLDLPLPRQGFGLITPAAASPFDDKPDEAKPDEAKPDVAKPDDEAKPDEAAPKDEAPAAAAPPTTTAIPASSPGTAAADNIIITRGTTTFHIKHIEMTGTTLSSADLAALFDSSSNEPLEARLKKLTATAIVVPEVLADDMTAGSERHASITQVLLSGASAGKIAAGSAAGVTFTMKDGDDDVSGSVGAVQASGVDLPQIVHVFGAVRSDDAEPILPLYDSVTATSIKVNNAKKAATFTLTALKETGLKARALKTDFIAGKKAGTATLTEAEKSALYDDMSHSFEIGTFEATGLEGKGDNNATYSLASIGLTDFTKAKVGGFTLRALRFEGPDAKFGVTSVDVGAFTLPPPKTATAPQGASMVPSSGKIDIGQIDFDGKSDGTDASGAPNRVKFKIAHAGFVSEGDPGDLPKTAKVTVDNFTFDVPATAGQAQPLYDMGYRNLDVSLGLATIYDPAAQSLMIHDLTVNGASMGSLALGLHLVNVTKGLVSSNQEVVKASALAILAKGLSLDLVNAGLVEKALEWKAKQDGLDVAKEKAFLIDFFDVKLPASLNNSANVKIVGSAISKFVADPKNLHISVESKSGLGVGSMALLSDPPLLIDSLDVKATANQ